MANGILIIDKPQGWTSMDVCAKLRGLFHEKRIGIRVNCVSPGVIETDMTAGLGPETLGALAEEAPLGRNGRPEDVAQAILYLCSEASAFVTGQVLSVNGGFVI